MTKKRAIGAPAIRLPTRSRGRQSAASAALYDEQTAAFCAGLMEIASRVEFKPSARGWCYVLEEYGLHKGDFDRAVKTINDCRKDGRLPLNITGEDGSRATVGLIDIDTQAAQDFPDVAMDVAKAVVNGYTPIDFWEDQEFYVEVFVEKGDLRLLFEPVCAEYHVPLTNAKGWSDIHSRARIMERMMERERQRKKCVLLLCNDHDPGGLRISDFMRSNLAALTGAVGWDPARAEIVRFGLNRDFVDAYGITWIDNLETSYGGDLASPGHPDHFKSYVQDYIAEHGARKVEANALIVRPGAARRLCREAIERYVSKSDVYRYSRRLKKARAAARRHLPAAARRFARNLSAQL